jgi:hypothetical protein
MLSLLVLAEEVQLVELIQLVLVKRVVAEDMVDPIQFLQLKADVAAAEAVDSMVLLHLAQLQIKLVFNLHGVGQHMVLMVVMV